MQIKLSPEVATVFANYPPEIRTKLMALRKLILETADELSEVSCMEETLKWGEPAYLCNSGSTLRIGWKPAKPNQYAMYFNCKTLLIETFRELYQGVFVFDGKRAIVFSVDDNIPLDELEHCIELSLCYHLRKHLPLLGA